MQSRAASSPEARRWLRDLVGHQTISGSQSNLSLLKQVDTFLSARGFRTRYTFSADGQRANLFASRGAEGLGGLLLAGHTDVVPVAGQHWTRPPFELTKEDGRLFGRGTCDMKGYLAAILAVLERQSGDDCHLPLHLGFTYDEEIGCVGVRPMLKDLAEVGIRPSACVVGEPTMMNVVRSHKGRHAWRCKVVGEAAHSSLSGLGVNATEIACRLVSEISVQAQRLKAAYRDEGFYVPYSTMATCKIQGGHAANVIPEETEFDFDLRYLPSQDPEAALAPIHSAAAELEREMKSRVSKSEIRLWKRTAVPALVADSVADRLVRSLIDAGASAGGHTAFTTEGGLYQLGGIPTVICGPGDIAQAHTADEFILDSQLGACEDVLERLVKTGM